MATIITSNSAASTTPAGSTAQDFVNTYNQNREQKIRDMYDASQRSTEAGLKTAYDQSMSAARQARDDISPQYQESMNQLSAEYERQRRNNNMQAAANGLNTGAGSQMALGQMNAYQKGQGQLATAENQALDKANQNILDLRTNYENQIAQAAANNDYRQAAALLDEYGAQYDRTMNQASQLAQYGDFSLYASIYGNAAAQQMEKNWALQNPDLAYNTGKLSAEEYRSMTGRYPRGYRSGGGGYSYGGGGYSASRDTAYYGPPLTGNNSSTGTLTYANKYKNVTANNIDKGAVQNSAFQGYKSSSASSSSSGGGTSYGNIGNNKITVGGGANR